MAFFAGILSPRRRPPPLVDLPDLGTHEQRSIRVADQCESDFEALKQKVNLLQQKVSDAKTSGKIISESEYSELETKVLQTQKLMLLAKEVDSSMKKVLSNDNLSTKKISEFKNQLVAYKTGISELSSIDDSSSGGFVLITPESDELISDISYFIQNTMNIIKEKLEGAEFRVLARQVVSLKQKVQSQHHSATEKELDGFRAELNKLKREFTGLSCSGLKNEQQMIEAEIKSEHLIHDLKEIKDKLEGAEFRVLAGRVDSLKKKVESKYSSATQKELDGFREELNILKREFTVLACSDLGEAGRSEEWEMVPFEGTNLISALSNDLRLIQDKLPDDLAFLKDFILKNINAQGFLQISGDFFLESDVVALAQFLKNPASSRDLRDLINDLMEMDNKCRSSGGFKFLDNFAQKLNKIFRDKEGFKQFKESDFSKFLATWQLKEKLLTEFTMVFIKASLFSTKCFVPDPSQFLWIPGDQGRKVLAQLNKVWENISH